MKKILFLLIVLTLGLTACKGNEPNQDNQVVEDNNKIDSGDEQDNSGEEQDNAQNDGTQNDIAEVIYMEPYATSDTINVYVENGEVKDMEFSTFSGKYSYMGVDYNLRFEWAYACGSVHYGEIFFREEWFDVVEMPNSPEKVLLYKNFGEIGMDPVYQIADLKTNTIEPIYEESFWQKNYIRDVYVTSDFSQMAVIGSNDLGIVIYYYNGNEMMDITDKFPIDWDERYYTSYDIAIVETSILLLLESYNGIDGEIYCYTYDYFKDEFKVTVDGVIDGSIDYDYTISAPILQRDIRYGQCNRDGYFNIVDLLTGRMDQTEILVNEIRRRIDIDEEYLFILADYGYVIEKATGRIVAQSEYPFKNRGADMKIIPSDEDIYVYIGITQGSYPIYKIEFQK